MNKNERQKMDALLMQAGQSMKKLSQFIKDKPLPEMQFARSRLLMENFTDDEINEMMGLMLMPDFAPTGSVPIPDCFDRVKLRRDLSALPLIDDGNGELAHYHDLCEELEDELDDAFSSQ